jgi:hypothetical protein
LQFTAVFVRRLLGDQKGVRFMGLACKTQLVSAIGLRLGGRFICFAHRIAIDVEADVPMLVRCGGMGDLPRDDMARCFLRAAAAAQNDQSGDSDAARQFQRFHLVSLLY